MVKNVKLTPAFSELSGKQLLCTFGNCHRKAWKEFSLPAFDKQNRQIIYVFCSWQHQAAQLQEWGEM